MDSQIYIPGKEMNPAETPLSDISERLIPGLRRILEEKAQNFTPTLARTYIDTFADAMQQTSGGNETLRLAQIGYPAFAKEVWAMYTVQTLPEALRGDRKDIIVTWVQLYSAARTLDQGA